MLLVQETFDLLPHTSCYFQCCHSFFATGDNNILVLSSNNFWASATTLHLGWHAHTGNGSAGKSNHTTAIPDPCGDCLKIVLGLTESMGEAGKCAAHKAPTSQVRVATQTSRCAAHTAPTSQAPVATKNKTNC